MSSISQNGAIYPNVGKLRKSLNKGTHFPDVGRLPSGSTAIAIDGKRVLDYRSLEQTASLVLAAVGTPFERDNPVPKYPVLELSLPESTNSPSLSLSDAWSVIYALWTILHEQEQIPITFSPEFQRRRRKRTGGIFVTFRTGKESGRPQLCPLHLPSADDVLARRRPGPTLGASSNAAGSKRRAHSAPRLSPNAQSFTRTDTVIAAHPTRAPKPLAGRVRVQAVLRPRAEDARAAHD